MHLLTLIYYISDFPSLSSNPPQQSLNSSTWTSTGTRNISQVSNPRLQSTLSSQQQQDDLFNSSSQLASSQGGFRFGIQNTVGQPSQSRNVDEFPPLSRHATGEIGQDRSASLMQNVGFGAQSNGLGFGSSNPSQANRNGLLNALSGNSRITSGNRVASPASLSGMWKWY